MTHPHIHPHPMFLRLSLVLPIEWQWWIIISSSWIKLNSLQFCSIELKPILGLYTVSQYNITMKFYAFLNLVWVGLVIHSRVAINTWMGIAGSLFGLNAAAMQRLDQDQKLSPASIYLLHSNWLNCLLCRLKWEGIIKTSKEVLPPDRLPMANQETEKEGEKS